MIYPVACLGVFSLLLLVFLYALHTEKSPVLIGTLLTGILASEIVFWWETGLGFGLLTLIFFGLSYYMISVMAKQNARRMKLLYSSPYEIADASLEDYPWLDADFYRTTSKELESLEFHHLGDWEETHLTKAWPNMQTMLRYYVNAENDIRCYFANIKMKRARDFVESGVNARMIEFVTEFSDGLILATNNAHGVNPVEEVEGSIIQQFPPLTPIETLLDKHEEKIDDICNERNVDVVLIRDKEDFLASARRGHAIYCKDRQKKGFFTDEEYRRIIASAGVSGDLAQKHLQAYRRQADKMKKELADEQGGL